MPLFLKKGQKFSRSSFKPVHSMLSLLNFSINQAVKRKKPVQTWDEGFPWYHPNCAPDTGRRFQSLNAGNAAAFNAGLRGGPPAFGRAFTNRPFSEKPSAGYSPSTPSNICIQYIPCFRLCQGYGKDGNKTSPLRTHDLQPERRWYWSTALLHSPHIAIFCSRRYTKPRMI